MRASRIGLGSTCSISLLGWSHRDAAKNTSVLFTYELYVCLKRAVLNSLSSMSVTRCYTERSALTSVREKINTRKRMQQQEFCGETFYEELFARRVLALRTCVCRRNFNSTKHIYTSFPKSTGEFDINNNLIYIIRSSPLVFILFFEMKNNDNVVTREKQHSKQTKLWTHTNKNIHTEATSDWLNWLCALFPFEMFSSLGWALQWVSVLGEALCDYVCWYLFARGKTAYIYFQCMLSWFIDWQPVLSLSLLAPII